MERVLVTAIGSFSADITIKELHKMNYEIVGCDIYNKEWIVDSNNVDFFEKAPLATNKDEYITFIKKICEKYDVKYILPLTDVEIDILCDYKSEFKKNGIIICISDTDVIKICRSKVELPKKLKEICPNNLIKTDLLNEIDEEKIEFPVIIKPIDGRSSQGLCRIYNKEEYKFYTNMCSDKDNMIIQPLINGFVVTVDVVSDLENDIAIAIPRRELLRTGNGAGTTVETFYNEQLINLCIKIAKKLKINGAVNMEFIEDANKNYYFLEINPRFAGGVEFSNIAGYNVINNHMRCYTNKKIDETPNFKKLIIARKYEEYIMKEKE